MTREEAIANIELIRVAFVEPVTKKQRKRINQTFDAAIKALEQEPKTGHWITKRTIMHDGEFYCDVCGNDAPFNKTFQYCPNCGARMECETI